MRVKAYLLVTQNGDNNGVFAVDGDLKMLNLETTDGVAIMEMSNGMPIVVDCTPGKDAENRITKVVDNWVQKKKLEIANG